jgi:Cu+-exporting ATPase
VADHRVLIGNRALMDEHRVVVSAAVPAAVAQVEERGETPVLIAVDGAVRAVVAVADPPRPQSITAVQALASRGVASLMLSGDTPRVAALMGARFGIADARGGVKPEDKAREIARLKAEGRVVAMVGDGVNDAPALAAADVGIAMGGATDVAMETAAITLLRPDPRLVAAAIDISRATWRKIRQNLFWAFIYNVVGVPLAALGLLTPALAGAAMAASSVSVVTNALLLKRWRPDLPDNPENQSKERS